jgi:hypothetical protein
MTLFFQNGKDGSCGFYVRDFHSFNCFAGTQYQFSMTLLERRPAALLIPIGFICCFIFIY